MIKYGKFKVYKSLKRKEKNMKSKDYETVRKATVFDNDISTRTYIITKLLQLRDESQKHFQELDFLLASNNLPENQKMKKGIIKVANDLIEMGEKLKKHLEIEEVEQI